MEVTKKNQSRNFRLIALTISLKKMSSTTIKFLVYNITYSHVEALGILKSLKIFIKKSGKTKNLSLQRQRGCKCFGSLLKLFMAGIN